MLTENPDKSPAASPSILAPFFTHAVPLQLYTRTWPAKTPFPSLLIAPIARVFASGMLTENPERSLVASASISAPFFTHAVPLQLYTLTWPA